MWQHDGKRRDTGKTAGVIICPETGWMVGETCRGGNGDMSPHHQNLRIRTRWSSARPRLMHWKRYPLLHHHRRRTRHPSKPVARLGAKFSDGSLATTPIHNRLHLQSRSQSLKLAVIVTMWTTDQGSRRS